MSNVTNRQWPHSQAPAGWPTTTNAAQPTTQPWPTVRMPTVPPAATEILRDAVWHIDAAEHMVSGANPKAVRNLGWGGSVLNARCGSTTVADTNDPKFLDFTGTPYVYLPGLAGNSLTCTAPAVATQYLATALNGTTASGAATGGAAFTFSTAGSWATVSLLDAGNAVLASFVGASLTAGSATAQTDAYAVAWTINRSTSGRKSVAVVAPVWLFGTDDYMSVPNSSGGSRLLDVDSGASFTFLVSYRDWSPSTGKAFIAKHSTVGAVTSSWGIFNSATTQAYLYSRNSSGAIASAYSGNLSAGAIRVMSGQIDRATRNVTAWADSIRGDRLPALSDSLTNQLAVTVGAASQATFYADMEFMSAAVFRRTLSASEISTLTTYLTGKYK